MNMKNDLNKRQIIRNCTIIACLVIVCLLLLINVDVCLNTRDGGGCISVTFDKLPMMIADRAVIRVGEKGYEITDDELIRQITSETRVATNTDLCNHNTERWIDIYCGDTLIRSMMWEDYHDGIIVYHTGIFHWVIPSDSGLGIVYPSEELLQKLEEIIEST